MWQIKKPVHCWQKINMSLQITTDVIMSASIALLVIDRCWSMLKALRDDDKKDVCQLHAIIEEDIQAVRKSVEHLEVLNEKENQRDVIMSALRDTLGVPGPTAADLRKEINVLVLDDEKGVRDIFKAGLDTPGISCLTAGTYEEAQGVIKNVTVDVVIADICLGGANTGLDFAAEYKLTNNYSRVFMMTGKKLDYKKDAFVERVFLKPVRLTDVITAIRDERRD
jgi:CheY-like chemotaxis protein